MVVKKDYALLCENAIIDDRKRFTIVNTFNTVWAKQVPVMHSQLFFVCNLLITGAKKGESVIPYELTVTDPMGKQILNSKLEGKVEGSAAEVNNTLAVNLSPMPIEHFGKYIFALKYNSKIVATRTLEAKKGDEENARQS